MCTIMSKGHAVNIVKLDIARCAVVNVGKELSIELLPKSSLHKSVL